MLFFLLHYLSMPANVKTEEPIDVEMESAETTRNGLDIDASKIKYVVEVVNPTGDGSRQTVTANQVQRTKNCLTKDKIYMIIKTNCEVNKQISWTLTEKAMEKHKVGKMKYTDIFRGEAPQYDKSFGRGQYARKLNESASNAQNKSVNASPSANKNKKKSVGAASNSSQLNNSKHKPSAQTNAKGGSSNGKSPAPANRSKSAPGKKSPNKNTKPSSTAASPAKSTQEKQVQAKRIAQILAKKGA